jgi:DNA polymerase-3 subunit delta'
MSWAQVRGHEHLVESFRRAVSRGRLAHGYLFVGPRGVGKTLFARELARAVLCEAPPAGAVLTACDRCASCLLVSAGTHPDLFVVRRPEDKNELPIDLMQQLCRDFMLRTARGRGKFAMLEDADDLNEESANCFLKTLEEPPPRSVFVLIAADADRILPTIRSRCQVMRFAPLAETAVRAVLQAQGIEDAAQLDRLVRLAGGSPGQALALADDVLWQCRRSLLEGLAADRPDPVTLARGLIEFAEEAGKELAPQRRRVLMVVRLLTEAFADALNLRLGAPPRTCEPDERPLLAALAERAIPETIFALVERCLETEAQINRYVQLALVLEGLMDGLCRSLRRS